MSKFFDDTMQGLLQAIEIENENIPLTERDGMPAPTFYVSSDDKELVDRLTLLYNFINDTPVS